MLETIHDDERFATSSVRFKLEGINLVGYI